MTKQDLQQHAKEQEASIQLVLRKLADALRETDQIHANGVNTSFYIDYDEQDMFNAATIFYIVCGNYAIKHKCLTAENISQKIPILRKVIKDTFGLDTIQEAKVYRMLNNI